LVKILDLNVTLPIQTNLNKTFIKSILTIIVIKMNYESLLKAERFMLIRSYVCFGFKDFAILGLFIKTLNSSVSYN